MSFKIPAEIERHIIDNVKGRSSYELWNYIQSVENTFVTILFNNHKPGVDIEKLIADQLTKHVAMLKAFIILKAMEELQRQYTNRYQTAMYSEDDIIDEEDDQE